MRFLSVCSGVDAASMAWTRAYGSPLDWTCAGYAEIEPFPRAVLEHRHGAVAVDWDHRWQEGQNYAPLFGDFTQIGAEHVGPVDLLVGGTPCQSFSVAGKRLGLDDPRGNRAIEFLALARRIGARWMVWENVPGVYSSWSGEPDDEAIEEWSETADFAEFLNIFRECGYRGPWRTLDAQYVRVDGFGRAVPQRRRRVFVVGHLGNDARAIPVLFDPDSLRGIAAPRRAQGEGLAGASGSDPSGAGGAGSPADVNAGRSAATVSAKWAKGSGGPAGDECQNLVAVPYVQTEIGKYAAGQPTLRRSGCDAGGGSEALIAVTVERRFRCANCGFTMDVEHAACPTCLIVFDTTQITSAANGSNPQPGDPCHPLAAAGHPPHVAFAIQERAVAPTISARPGGGGGLGTDAELDGAVVAVPFIGDVSATVTSNGDAHSGFRNADGLVATPAVNGWTVRKLTPRECERLQGFPDDFTAIRWRGKPASQCRMARATRRLATAWR